MNSTLTLDATPAATTKTLTVQGAQIFLTERGRGIPTLFLHGVPDSGAMWDGMIRQLAGAYHCIAPDLPGLGRSTAPAQFDLSLENKARFVAELIAAADIRGPLNLVVHDFGGHYGLAWAVRHPEQVRRIAIFSTSFFTSHRWHSNARIWRTPILGELSLALTNRSLFLRTMRPLAPGLSEEYLNQMYASISPPAVRRMILRLYRTANPADFAGWEDDFRTLAARVPTCVLWGDKDPFADRSYAERFGAGTVRHFPEYDHWLPVEAAGQMAALLRPFLA